MDADDSLVCVFPRALFFTKNEDIRDLFSADNRQSWNTDLIPNFEELSSARLIKSPFTVQKLTGNSGKVASSGALASVYVNIKSCNPQVSRAYVPRVDQPGLLSDSLVIYDLSHKLNQFMKPLFICRVRHIVATLERNARRNHAQSAREMRTLGDTLSL